MKTKILILWPLFFILMVWFIFAHPYFLKGLVPFPSKYQVTFFHPWSMYDKWWGPVKNNAMPDVISQIYPWKYFTIKSVINGEMPFWNPHSFAGNPHIANYQSAFFSPFNLLFFIMPFIDAWSIGVLIQPLLAGLFTYLLMRELKISILGSVIGSITFMFCGFNVVWMAYGTLTFAISYLPLSLYSIEKTFNTGKRKFLILLSLSIILSYFSGHIQASFYLTVFILFFLLFKYLTLKNTSKLISSLIFFLLGMILSMIQIFPTLKLYSESVRSNILYSGGGIPWNYLITVIAPDFYGNPVTRNDWFGTYAEWSSFVGIVPFFLMLLSFFNRKSKYVRFFIIAGIVSLLLALESPLHNLLIATKIPILATSIPSRIIALYSFSISILAGFGMDILINRISKNKLKYILTVSLALVSSILLIFVIIILTEIIPADKKLIAIKNLILPLSITVGIPIVVFINKLLNNKYLLYVTCLILLLLVSFDSLRFAGKWMPFDSRELVYPDLPVIKAMQKNLGFGRVFGNIGNEINSYYGLSSTEGYDPLYIKRYGEFVRYASTGKWSEAERSVAKFSRTSNLTPRALDLLSVNLIYHPIADTNTSWAYPVWRDSKKYSLLYSDDKFQIFRNNTALPRVKLYYDYEVVTAKDKILQKIFSEDHDIKETLILEKKPQITLDNKIAQKSYIKVEKYGNNRILVKVSTNKEALLYLTDNYYPSWKVYVNGKKSELLRANYTFRAVAVPRGESIVEFKYEEYF